MTEPFRAATTAESATGAPSPPATPIALSALLLLGSFAFAYNAATALHEVGHVLAAWLTGGTIRAFVLHPFATSFVTIRPDPHPGITHAAGVVFTSAVGVVIAGMGPRLRTPFSLPLRVTGVAALATSGIYLVVGYVQEIGDARVLIQLGFPAAALLGIGIAAAAGAIVLALASLPALGIQPQDSLLRRLLILELGVLPYLAAMLGYQWIDGTSELRVWAAFVAAGVGILGVVAGLSLFWMPGRGESWGPHFNPLPWSAVVFSLGLGGVFVIGELLLF